jgi:NADPH:quinone reductase-like Zn-dependent oxidoreductase
MTFRALYTQLFPPAPPLTEDNVPSQRGKVFIVTGGNSGVGFELCKILYTTGATIYMTSRSEVSFIYSLITLKLTRPIGTRNECYQANYK